jgi:hypothetical protein
MSGFGITEDLQASNKIPFKGGIQKGVLTGVTSYEKTSKKGQVFDVLEFKFVDLKNEATFEKIEFAVDANDAKATDKTKALNIRIKHIYEVFAPFPKDGIGTTATNWVEYFAMIAKAFNENGEGTTPIFKSAGKLIPVYLKFTYFNNVLGLPYSPNFIEVIKEGRETNLTIDKRYDVIEQVEMPKKAAGLPNLGTPASNNDFDEFHS